MVSICWQETEKFGARPALEFGGSLVDIMALMDHGERCLSSALIHVTMVATSQEQLIFELEIVVSRTKIINRGIWSIIIDMSGKKLQIDNLL